MNSTHNHLCEDVEIYVLGGLSAEEIVEFEHHLKTCAACQARVDELQDVTEALLFDVADVEPPAGMRERVLSHVTATPQEQQIMQEPGRQVLIQEKTEQHTSDNERTNKQVTTRSWQHRLFPYVSAAAVIALLLLGWQNVHLQQQNASQQNQINELGKLVATIPMQSIDRFKQVDGQAMVLENGTQKIVMVKAINLPMPTQKQQYTLWIKNQNRVINGGTFIPTGNGVGMIVFPVTIQKFDSVAVTLEPDAYSGDTPRGVPVMVGKVRL